MFVASFAALTRRPSVSSSAGWALFALVFGFQVALPVHAQAGEQTLLLAQSHKQASEVEQASSATPPATPRATPLPVARATPPATPRATPLPVTRATPLPAVRTTPLPVARPTPLPAARTTPLPAKEEADATQCFWGLSLQAYPTGLLPAITWERAWASGHAVHARAGANLFDHRDLGVQDEERGHGWGAGAGWRWYIPSAVRQNNWFVGARADVWFNRVRWQNQLDPETVQVGETDLIVLQPTAEAGYRFWVSDRFALAPHAGFGWEWNARTDGSPTGKGAILLLGLRVSVLSHGPKPNRSAPLVPN